MNPLVSIIVPNYNHELYLKQRLESVFNQTFQDFEVLIFDDASTDNSVEILETYKNHAKVSHFSINKINSGSPFKQWKEGMLLAKGDYIWIAETDDYADLDFLKHQVEAIKSNIASVARTKIVENQTQTEKEVFHPAFTYADATVLNSKLFLSSPIKNVSCILFKKPDFVTLEQMTFNQYSFMGDQFFYLEYFKNRTLVYNPSAISYFRRISTSLSNFNQNKELSYHSKYLDQHLEFGKRLLHELDKKEVLVYYRKYFNKIKNRTSRKQKMTFKYFSLLIHYYWARL